MRVILPVMNSTFSQRVQKAKERTRSAVQKAKEAKRAIRESRPAHWRKTLEAFEDSVLADFDALEDAATKVWKDDSLSGDLSVRKKE